ncbi:MAG: 2-keto-4-pentenoate hydratase [Pontibacterium sp.]
MPPSTKAAAFLLDLWSSGQQTDQLATGYRPDSLPQGYEAQNAFIDRSQKTPIGWKLGIASPLQLKVNSLSRPLIGKVLKERCFTDGAKLDLPASGTITIECELGITLKHDLDPKVCNEAAWSDIESLYFTFEIVRSRFFNRKSVGWPSFVADNVGFEALVIGQPITLAPSTNEVHKLQQSTQVLLNGTCVSKPLLGDKGVCPLTALNHLLAHAKEYGYTLPKGDIVSTGAFCEPFDLSSRNDHIEVTTNDHSLSFIS